MPTLEERLGTPVWLLRRLAFSEDTSAHRTEEVFEVGTTEPAWGPPAHGRWVGRPRLDGLRLEDEQQRELDATHQFLREILARTRDWPLG